MTVTGVNPGSTLTPVANVAGTAPNYTYTAPSPVTSEQTVTLTATSTSDSKLTASVTITLVPATVAVSPATASVTVGGALLFSASVSGGVEGESGVAWTASSGTINGSGEYTAPSAPGSATVTACLSVSKSICGTATVTVLAQLTITGLSPATLNAGANPVNLTISGTGFVTGAQVAFSDTRVTATNPVVNTAGTTITGMVSASSSVGSETVYAIVTNPGGSPVNSSQVMTIVPISYTYTITVSPSAVTLNASQTAQFTAVVTCKTNLGGTCSTPSAAWQAPSLGSISTNGLYTAPSSVPSTETTQVYACVSGISVCSAKSTVTLTPVVVTVSPATITLFGGQNKQFTTTVSGTTNTSVTWSANAPSGLYTAPTPVTAAQNVSVTACSAVVSTSCGSAVVSLVPVGITNSPTSASLAPGGSQQFAATVTGATNTAVTWTAVSVAGQLYPAPGTISNGLYKAASSIVAQQFVTVSACAVATPSPCATASVTVTAPPTINSGGVVPSSITLGTGGYLTVYGENLEANGGVTVVMNGSCPFVQVAATYVSPVQLNVLYAAPPVSFNPPCDPGEDILYVTTTGGQTSQAIQLNP